MFDLGAEVKSLGCERPDREGGTWFRRIAVGSYAGQLGRRSLNLMSVMDDHESVKSKKKKWSVHVKRGVTM